jgi:hypothetical protein
VGKELHYANKHIVGGAAILTFGLLASKVINAFPDPCGFGSFTVTTIQGKGNKHISIISAYIAVQKGSDIGIDSLYAQQFFFMNAIGSDPKKFLPISSVPGWMLSIV